MFSRRTPPRGSANRLTHALAARGRPYVDLTTSNPTTAKLPAATAPPLEALADPRGAVYAPDPLGLASAREAVSAWYAARGADVPADRLVLTASSSEAYSWLFKLLCEPGETVLVPAPSYPLLDALAVLEGAALDRYALPPEDRWSVQAGLVADAVDRVAARGSRVAAVVLVNPNNPTGSSIRRGELEQLFRLAEERGFALISDEVFLDYRFAGTPDEVKVAVDGAWAPAFSLGGLSKSAALPQLKLGWIACGGREPLLGETLERLAWIADSFLSVGTPVQLALPALLGRAGAAAAAVRQRVLANAAVLREAFADDLAKVTAPAGSSPVTVSPLLGGWSAVLRVPAVAPEEEIVLRLLADQDVLVHPGYFFEFPFEAFLVVSLLAPPDVFREGAVRLARGLGA